MFYHCDFPLDFLWYICHREENKNLFSKMYLEEVKL